MIRVLMALVQESLDSLVQALLAFVQDSLFVFLVQRHLSADEVSLTAISQCPTFSECSLLMVNELPSFPPIELF